MVVVISGGTGCLRQAMVVHPLDKGAHRNILLCVLVSCILDNMEDEAS